VRTILQADQVLADRYKIERYLAAGGMQEVYVGWDRILARRVVIKTPKRGTKDLRFQRGAEMSARISHPNVAATFDYCDKGTPIFLVEEFIEGSDLGQRLAGDFLFFDPALAVHVIHHVGRALYEAHHAGICHRDLKPSNILVSADHSLRVIKLTDFGIAKLAESTIADEMEDFEKDESSLTSSNTLLGAVPYMAPECWANWRTAGQPMDIWALGCLAHQLLTGSPPFGTGRAAIANVLKAEQQGKVDLVRPTWFGTHTSTSTLEQELWAIICSCLRIDPSTRPSAEQILRQCSLLCYAVAERVTGVVTTYPMQYASGRKGDCGFIDDSGGKSHFFHLTEFFGGNPPASKQRVCFSSFAGVPKPRLSPVLLLRP
jgi:serine/threonine protein kinase